MATPSEFEKAYFAKNKNKIYFWAEQLMLDTDLVKGENSPMSKQPPILLKFVYPLAFKLSYQKS